MSLAQASQLIYHLSTMTKPRRPKAKQIWIEAVPDAGKTTLKNPLQATFKHRCFSVSVESKNFMAAAFSEYASDAIWLEDEFDKGMFDAFHAKHYNKITEGDLNTCSSEEQKAKADSI